jgi:hypothetical protein
MATSNGDNRRLNFIEYTPESIACDSPIGLDKALIFLDDINRLNFSTLMQQRSERSFKYM